MAAKKFGDGEILFLENLQAIPVAGLTLEKADALDVRWKVRCKSYKLQKWLPENYRVVFQDNHRLAEIGATLPDKEMARVATEVTERKSNFANPPRFLRIITNEKLMTPLSINSVEKAERQIQL